MTTLIDTIINHCGTQQINLRHSLFAQYNNEKEELLKRKMKKILNQEYQLEQLGPLYNKLKSLENTNEKRLKEKLAEKNNNAWFWATINPKNDISFEKFRKVIEKIAKYSCFAGCVYTYEQRGTLEEDNLGKGFHAHMIMKRNLNYKPKDLEAKLRRGCKSIVGNILNNHQVNTAKIGYDFAGDKYKYITGSKKLEKQDKQIADRIFRKNRKLKSIYNFNISPDIINAWKKKISDE